jgi:UDP-3-O-acyl N-acetylglucosamine deacetylase
MQKTISNRIEYSGIGLHTGKITKIAFVPAMPDTGIKFRRTDLKGRPEIPATSDFFIEMPVMCSCVGLENGTRVQLIEHLMAVFCAYGIDNLIIEIDNEEPPFEDGSSKFVVEMIKNAGIKEQDAPDRIFRLSKPVVFKQEDIEITAFPSDSFRVSFFGSYNHPLIGTSAYSMEMDAENFSREIAPAKTFCFEEDVEKMRKVGLLKGASENSALVFGKESLLVGELQYPDEAIRHKLLDLIGDLYLLGARLLAHVTASRSGHITHARFVKLLRKEIIK